MSSGLRSLVGVLSGLVLCAAAPAAAQQPEPRAPRTADEHHAARREWLERQRQGDTATAAPVYGGARGPARDREDTGRAMAPDRRAAGRPYGSTAGPYGGAYSPWPPHDPSGPYGAWGGYGGPAGAPLTAWCVAELRRLQPPGGGTGLPLLALEALCVPRGPQYGQPFGYGRPQGTGEPSYRYRSRPRIDPAYPPVNRFHERFLPPADRPTAGVPDYGSGIHVLPPDPWRLPPWYFGVEPAACAEVLLEGLSGTVWVEVGLPVLGATTAAELELAIDARLSQGLPVLLEGLDGRRLRIAPGTELERLSARRCEDPR